jgi:hypothetical protein
MMAFLLENPATGERVHTGNKAGYDGWTVLAEGPNAEPVAHAEFRDGKWHVDASKKAKADRRALAALMSKEDLMDRLEALEARVQALETKGK